MPTKPMSPERQEELRREDWEDRQYYNERLTETRAYELEVLAHKNAHEESLAMIKYAEAARAKIKLAQVNDRRNRVIVHCITILSLFRSPVPQVLLDLLDS